MTRRLHSRVSWLHVYGGGVEASKVSVKVVVESASLQQSTGLHAALT